MKRIAVLVSGGGTNLQALIDTQKKEGLGGGEIVLVVSSKPGVQALERAKNAGIKTALVERKKFACFTAFDDALADILYGEKIELVVLAGFLSVLGPRVLQLFADKIINVHPALIPSFCGKGFYGIHVHEEALKYGVKVTGATVHLVNEVIDGGKILLQKAIDVLPDDTPETLQQRVMRECEWVLLPKAVAMMCEGGKT
jgi:phosphoribosylglycinamide formyltransferase-1